MAEMELSTYLTRSMVRFFLRDAWEDVADGGEDLSSVLTEFCAQIFSFPLSQRCSMKSLKVIYFSL